MPSTTPAVDSAHLRNCRLSGERIVDLVKEDTTPSKIVTQNSITNALITYGALGGSTNAVIHLVAMANRLGIPLDLKTIDGTVSKVPVVINLMPSGKYLMQDFHHAGGLSALHNQIKELLNLKCLTVTGKSLGENIEGSEIFNDDVILPMNKPLKNYPTMTALYGNLCEDGAVIKPVAASEQLLEHRGQAVVFENMQDMQDRINSPDLDVTEDSVLVLKNAGPQGGPGMPEWGGLPIPKKLLQKGVKDMVRISDARMSGTHFGTCILHVSPESFVGGNLALVQNGDWITFSLKNKQLNLEVSDTELIARRKNLKPAQLASRGWLSLYQRHVNQAHLGCDFDFLAGQNTDKEPIIF